MTQKESLPTRLLKYKIIEPNPNEKGEYRYTDNFHNFWTEDRKTYEGFEVDYIFDNQEQIRQDFIRSMLFGYSEKYVLVPRERRYPITDGPDVDDEIVEDLASSLSFTEEEADRRSEAIEAAEQKEFEAKQALIDTDKARASA